MEIVESIAKKSGGVYHVTLQSGVTVRFPAPVLRAFRLKIGEPLDMDTYWQDHRKEVYRFAMDRAVYLLSRKDYSEKMLGEKITQVGYPSWITLEVIRFLRERGFLDDKRFALRIVEQKSKSMGRMRIRQYLAQKGIDKAIIQELLDEQIDEDQQLRIAVEYMEKYLRKRADQDKRRLYSNALGMLARRGFSFELANRAYRIAEESAENPDN